jgi:hypothetical protein
MMLILKEMKYRSGNDYRVDMVTIVNASNGDLRKDKVSVFEYQKHLYC